MAGCSSTPPPVMWSPPHLLRRWPWGSGLCAQSTHPMLSSQPLRTRSYTTHLRSSQSSWSLPRYVIGFESFDTAEASNSNGCSLGNLFRRHDQMGAVIFSPWTSLTLVMVLAEQQPQTSEAARPKTANMVRHLPSAPLLSRCHVLSSLALKVPHPKA